MSNTNRAVAYRSLVNSPRYPPCECCSKYKEMLERRTWNGEVECSVYNFVNMGPGFPVWRKCHRAATSVAKFEDSWWKKVVFPVCSSCNVNTLAKKVKAEDVRFCNCSRRR